MRSPADNVFRKCPLWPQWLAVVEIGLLSLVLGIMNGWTSPYLARLIAPDSELPITEDEASWVASLLNVGRLIGAAVGGIAQYYFSSKKVLLVTGVPVALSWVFLMVANSVAWLHAARISSGIGMGSFFASYPLFVGEISDPKIRGALMGLIMSCMPLGNLMGNIMGPYMPMATFAAISLVPSLMYLGLFVLFPESPHYLTRLKKYDEAAKAMRWYQREVDVIAEMESLKQFMKIKESLSAMDIIRELNRPRNRKALLIANMLFFFMQLSGIHSIYFYMEIILKNARVTVIPPATVVYIAGGAASLAGLGALYMIDKYGRKFLLAFSSAGTALSLMLFACHFTLLHASHYDPENLQWISIIASVVFQTFVYSGISIVPSTIMGELFPPDIKSTAACIVSVLSGLFAFVSSKTFQPLIDVMYEEYIFGLYASLMIALLIFCVCYIPETKGKSLQQIQEMLTRKTIAR